MIISPAKATEAANVLNVTLATLTTADLSQAYRDKAKRTHPDYHGNAKLEEWSRVSWAYECLTHWLQHQPTLPSDGRVEQGPVCQACGGTGRRQVTGRRFGMPLTILCSTCRGEGTLEPVEDDHD